MERKVIPSRTDVDERNLEMRRVRWRRIGAVLCPHLGSTGYVRERPTKGVKNQLTTRESVPPANHFSHLLWRLYLALAVPYSQAAADVEAKTRSSAVDEACEEAGPDPHEFQWVSERPGCLSGQGGNSDALNMVPTYLIVH